MLAECVDAVCFEPARFMIPDGAEEPDLCLKVWLYVFREDVALEWREDADGVHLEELVRTEVVPGEGEVVLEDGLCGEGEDDVLVHEGAVAWLGGRAGFWFAVGIDGGF